MKENLHMCVNFISYFFDPLRFDFPLRDLGREREVFLDFLDPLGFREVFGLDFRERFDLFAEVNGIHLHTPFLSGTLLNKRMSFPFLIIPQHSLAGYAGEDLMRYFFVD